MTRDFEGKNIQDAVEKACRQLNLAADRLNYEVIRKEGRKILGFLGGKTALIRVTLEEKQGSDLVKELIESALATISARKPWRPIRLNGNLMRLCPGRRLNRSRIRNPHRRKRRKTSGKLSEPGPRP
jgi:predicted RNA-binding protein Jag